MGAREAEQSGREGGNKTSSEQQGKQQQCAKGKGEERLSGGFEGSVAAVGRRERPEG